MSVSELIIEMSVSLKKVVPDVPFMLQHFATMSIVKNF